jgi:hypothetical protein
MLCSIVGPECWLGLLCNDLVVRLSHAVLSQFKSIPLPGCLHPLSSGTSSVLRRRYLLGAFARGMDYDADGLIRAEWPTSGHWEVTPMAWVTMHWTLFTEVRCRHVTLTVCVRGKHVLSVRYDRLFRSVGTLRRVEPPLRGAPFPAVGTMLC